jgi:hypothetical protein
MRAKHAAFVILVAVAVAGCAGAHYTIVPPAVDLTAFESVGLVTLKAAEAKGDLEAVASQDFLEEVTAAQRVPVVELGPSETVLADLGRTSFDRETALALGQKHGVDAFFAGEIGLTKVKPQLDLAAPLSKTLFAHTAMNMTVKVRLVSAKNGATIWTNSATRQITLGSVGIDNGVPVFAVRDKNAALNDLLRQIMYQMTWDFRPTRQRL